MRKWNTVKVLVAGHFLWGITMALLQTPHLSLANPETAVAATPLAKLQMQYEHLKKIAEEDQASLYLELILKELLLTSIESGQSLNTRIGLNHLQSEERVLMIPAGLFLLQIYPGFQRALDVSIRSVTPQHWLTEHTQRMIGLRKELLSVEKSLANTKIPLDDLARQEALLKAAHLRGQLDNHLTYRPSRTRRAGKFVARGFRGLATTTLSISGTLVPVVIAGEMMLITFPDGFDQASKDLRIDIDELKGSLEDQIESDALQTTQQ